MAALISGALGLFCFVPALGADYTQGDAAQPALTGKLVSTGSDTLGSLTSQWAEMLTRRYPQVLAQVRAIGSGAAPTALIQGTADIGPMSRPMSPQEKRRFFRRYGYAPTALRVARDSLAVFVHRDNPLSIIRLDQLDAVFSITRRCGSALAVRDWAGLGLAGDWGVRPISAYGRSTASGTYSFFRREVLCKGDFSPSLNRLVGSSAVVRAVAGDRDGIGYASAGYINENVKRLRVLQSDGIQEAELSRSLYLYINRKPGAALDPLLAAYLGTALSEDGQREVAKAGYQPLSESTRLRLLERLGLHGN